MKHSAKYLGFALLAAAAAGCSKAPAGWSVQGSVDAPDSTLMLIEAGNNGLWYTVDSLRIKNGTFEYHSDAPAAYPDVMRLSFDGCYVYFPVDSTEAVHVMAMGDSYSLTGSQQARTISALDSLIRIQTAAVGTRAVLEDEAFKKDLFARAFADPSILPAYYLLNRSIGSRKLYDPERKSDLRMYGAVAQRFSTDRPDDIRGKYLTYTFLKGRALSNGTSLEPQQIAVPETGVIDIVRYDRLGQSHSLSEMASKGSVVLLSFTTFSDENSPAYNVLLGDLYEKYHDSGLEIYQLAFDADESFWRQTAAKLPWTAVWNSTTEDFSPLTSYNVAALPTAFVIDRKGNICQRVTDPAELETAVKKYL